jgi:HEPN domain-containing protein
MPREAHALARQFRAKAESDLRAAGLLHGGGSGLEDAVCFHCQQAVEKMLKAALLVAGTEPPRTHDVSYLIEVLATLRPLPDQLQGLCAQVADLAVAPRYPGWDAALLGIDPAQVLEAARRAVDLLVPLSDADPSAPQGAGDAPPR